MTPTPITDELERVVGAEAHASAPTGTPGGEWDAWRHLPLRSRRRLIGARRARAGAMSPDELADLICRNKGIADYRDALDWYYRMALAAIDERRNAHRRDRDIARARAAGHSTAFHHRNAQAVEAGHASLWHMRKAKGWSSNRPARWKPNLTLIHSTRETHTCTTNSTAQPSAHPTRDEARQSEQRRLLPPENLPPRRERHLHVVPSPGERASTSAPCATTSPTPATCSTQPDSSW